MRNQNNHVTTNEQTKNEADNTNTIDLLIYRIAQGDESAMERFYKEHHKTVYAFAKSRLYNQQDAVEIVNEVMMEVWRSADKFENRSKLSTWLLGIAYHKIVDKIRKNSRHEHDDIDKHADIALTEFQAEDNLQQLEDKQLISLAINTLNPDQQQVVYLAFYKGMGYPEIARILNCPEGTVKTRMMHAKAKIKSFINQIDSDS